jgi:hypothetical protein
MTTETEAPTTTSDKPSPPTIEQMNANMAKHIVQIEGAEFVLFDRIDIAPHSAGGVIVAYLNGEDVLQAIHVPTLTLTSEDPKNDTLAITGFHGRMAILRRPATGLQ